jgi:hypothetical protein
MEEVACNFCLVCQMDPQLEREIDDGLFCSIDAMIVGFHELNCTVVGGDKLFNGSCSVIVCDIEGGGKAFVCEIVKDGV